MKKYRAGKIKREHTVIEKVWPALERMAECELITSILPGTISRLSSKGFEVTFQRFTETGLRLLAKNGAAVQEVYIVAPAKEAALRWLAEQGLVDWQPPQPELPTTQPAGSGPTHNKSVVLPSDMACETCGKLMMAGARAVRMGQKSYYYVHVRCAK